jgi:hypothetical protein
MYAYSNIAVHGLALLRCVPIAGHHPGSRFLMTAAYMQCYQPWQVVLICLMVFFMLAPLALAWLLWRGRKKTAEQQSPMVGLLAAPYHPHVMHWESVLLLYRMLTITIYSAVPNALDALLLLVGVSSMQLLLHVRYRPFRTKAAHHLQSLALSCLLLMATLSLPSATLIMNASTTSAGTSHTVYVAGWLQLVLLFLPVLAVAANMLWQRLKCRCAPESAALGDLKARQSSDDRLVPLLEFSLNSAGRAVASSDAERHARH